MIDTERPLEDNGLSYRKESIMFKVGDKVVWVGGGPESWDIGAEGLVTRVYEECGDERCFVHFTTGEDAGHVVDSILAEHLMYYDDFKSRMEAGKSADEMQGNIMDACQTTISVQKNKYLREIKQGAFVDVYDVLKAWNVINPALQHLIKKALQAGDRGHKDLETDLQDIVDSALRAKQLEGF